MLDPVRERAQGERGDFSARFAFVIAIGHHTGKIRNFRYPTAVFLSFDFYSQHCDRP